MDFAGLVASGPSRAGTACRSRPVFGGDGSPPGPATHGARHARVASRAADLRLSPPTPGDSRSSLREALQSSRPSARRMTREPTNDLAGHRAIEPDVLIIGGGVFGLWLLNELHQRKYLALLLERRELGGEQTCHSHVYLHEGHLYREAQKKLSAQLREVHVLWDAWLTAHAVERGFEPSCFGFKSAAAADARVALWSQLGLPATETPAPAALTGGKIMRTFRTGGRCLTGESLVEHLRRDVDDLITRVDEIEAITVTLPPAGAEVTEVRAMVQDEPLLFRPRALVIAAGAGNQALLDLAAGGRRPLAGVVREAQQLRLAHMLIVRGAADDLEPMTGIFPDAGGLFLVSRVMGDEVIWLVSDNRSPPLSFAEEWLAHDTRRWLPRVLLELREIAPSQFAADKLCRLRWGAYDAPKAERRVTGTLPDQEQIEQFHIKNLWAVWPTKLTLAPKASRAVTSQIRKVLGAPTRKSRLPPAWTTARRRPDTAPERWRQTPILPWDEFKRCHRIDSL